MFMTMITLFMLMSLFALLGVSTFAVMHYLNDERMEKVPVRIDDRPAHRR